MTDKKIPRKALYSNKLDPKDPKYVRSILDYNPETGVFVWKYRTDIPVEFNPRFVGKVAGYKTANGYLYIGINQVRYGAHRLAWAFMTRAWPEHDIDHINGRRLDNAWKNLRNATRSENLWNQGKSPLNTSGFKGVYFYKRDGVWVAQINHRNKNYYLGRFSSAQAAHNAYKKAAEKMHGKFSRVE